MAVLLSSLSGWNPVKPTVFVIGDSISIQYGPYLEHYIKDMAHYSRKEDSGEAEINLDVPVGANAGDSRMVLAYIESKLRDPDFRPDFVLLNCGLHDIKRDRNTGEIQVEARDYRNHLYQIAKLLQEKNIGLIWIRTTPVFDHLHNTRNQSFFRYSADQQNYNRIADEVFEDLGIPIINLEQISLKLGEQEVIDHVHFSEFARQVQASYIAGFLESHFFQRSSP